MYKKLSSSSYSPQDTEHPISVLDHPLSYCIGNTLEQKFNHGPSSSIGITGQDSKVCQLYMADYCALGFDDLCKVASSNTDVQKVNYVKTFIDGSNYGNTTFGLNQGDVLIRNAAIRKYLKNTSCNTRTEAFDFTRVHSPLIREYDAAEGGECFAEYSIPREKLSSIDDDPIMTELINNPWIAPDLLENIYKNLKEDGLLLMIRGSKLYEYFNKVYL